MGAGHGETPDARIPAPRPELVTYVTAPPGSRRSAAGAVRVDRVAQAVADQIQREHQDHDREAGEQRIPGRLEQEVARRREHRAPLWGRRLRSQPKEAERRL